MYATTYKCIPTHSPKPTHPTPSALNAYVASETKRKLPFPNPPRYTHSKYTACKIGCAVVAQNGHKMTSESLEKAQDDPNMKPRWIQGYTS